MSFSDLESSNQDAIPVSLYRFMIADNRWCYASTDYEVTVGSDTYIPMPISDSGMTVSGDPTTDEFVVTMPITEFVELFQSNPPSLTCYLTVRRKNRGAPDARVVWVGEVRGVKAVDGVTAEVSASALSASFERKGLRLSYGRGCPYALYDICCKVNKDDFVQVYTIADLASTFFYTTISMQAGPGHFDGGFFEWTRPEGFIERRMIEGMTDNRVEVLGTTIGLEPGMTVRFYPGCARTTEQCDLKFNNLPNYGGFNQMPGKSPFGNDPVF